MAEPRSTGIALDRASVADAPEITELYHEAYRPLADAGLNFTATYQDVDHTREELGRREVYVARRNGRIVGTVSVRERPQTAEHSRDLYVTKLAVSPTLKGSGLGSSLLSFAERLARERGLDVVRLDTAKPATDLVAWYDRRGYKPIAETHWPGKTYDSVILEKRL